MFKWRSDDQISVEYSLSPTSRIISLRKHLIFVNIFSRKVVKLKKASFFTNEQYCNSECLRTLESDDLIVRFKKG